LGAFKINILNAPTICSKNLSYFFTKSLCMRSFTNLALALAFFFGFMKQAVAQVTSCPEVEVIGAPGFSLACGQTCTTLVARFPDIRTTTTYSVAAADYSSHFPYQIGGATPVNFTGGDMYSALINLPFTFCFYGTQYNQVVIGANGTLTFTTTYANTASGYSMCNGSTPITLPSTATAYPKNAIFAAFQDLDPTINSPNKGVEYSFQGSSPCRKLVVNWRNIAQFNCTAQTATFQCVLSENTNVIEVYIQDKPVCSAWNCGMAAVGVQNAAGTAAVTPPGRNTSVWGSTGINEAWRFIPNGTSLLTNVQVTNTDSNITHTLTAVPDVTPGVLTANIPVCVPMFGNNHFVVKVDYTPCSGPSLSAKDSVNIASMGIVQGPFVQTPVDYCQGDTPNPLYAEGDSLKWYDVATGGSPLPGVPTPVTDLPGTFRWWVTQKPGNCESQRVPITVNVWPVYADTTYDTICRGQYIVFHGDTITTGGYHAKHYKTIHLCDSVKVLMLFIPDVQANFNPTLLSGCGGDTLYFQNTSIGSFSDSWAVGDGTTYNVASPQHQYPAQGNYSATLAIVGDYGCTDTLTKQIHWPKQVSDLFSDFYYNTYWGCTEDTVMFYNSSIDAAFYRWDFGDGTSDTTTNAVHHYAQQGVYDVSLYAMTHHSGGGLCVDTMTRTVDLTHPLHASFSVADDTVCLTTSILFQNNSVASSYVWDFGDGTISTLASPTHTYASAGVYTVMLMASDNVPCSEAAYQTIVVDDLPGVAFTVDDSVLCQGAGIPFTATYAQQGNTYIQWTMGDGSVIPDVNPLRHAYDYPGQYKVRLDAFYRRCPANFSERDILVIPAPQISLGPDTTICPNGEPFTIYDRLNGSTPGASWLWNTGETGPALMIRYPGTYAATVTVSGCSNTDSLTVLKDCYLTIPNAFTPDGDGVNDYFLPRQLLSKGAVAFKMSIFNRWGELIYETTKIDGRGWDGRFNDKEQPQGVYVYLIEVAFKNGTSEKYQGNVTLIR
jgi:gliding motility-associated-like protein